MELFLVLFVYVVLCSSLVLVLLFGQQPAFRDTIVGRAHWLLTDAAPSSAKCAPLVSYLSCLLTTIETVEWTG